MTEYERRKLNQTINMHKCPICGKQFPVRVAPENYGYRLRPKGGMPMLFCSYSCMRKFEKPLQAKIDEASARRLDAACEPY